MRYFFHTEDGICLPDKDGTELPDIESAKREAIRFISERLIDEPDLFWESGQLRLIVKDESGLTLFLIDLSATYSAAFPPRAEPRLRQRRA